MQDKRAGATQATSSAEHMVDKPVDASDGFDQILKALDQCFKYDHRLELPRALERFFYQLSRRSDLLAYCSEHRELLRA